MSHPHGDFMYNIIMLFVIDCKHIAIKPPISCSSHGILHCVRASVCHFSSHCLSVSRTAHGAAAAHVLQHPPSHAAPTEGRNSACLLFATSPSGYPAHYFLEFYHYLLERVVLVSLFDRKSYPILKMFPILFSSRDSKV